MSHTDPSAVATVCFGACTLATIGVCYRNARSLVLAGEPPSDRLHRTFQIYVAANLASVVVYYLAHRQGWSTAGFIFWFALAAWAEIALTIHRHPSVTTVDALLSAMRSDLGV